MSAAPRVRVSALQCAYAHREVLMVAAAAETNQIAFPTLNDVELQMFEAMACAQEYADGEIVFHAGDADLDLFVVKSGAIDILNPTDGDRLIVTHGPGQFAGDIDLLT